MKSHTKEENMYTNPEQVANLVRNERDAEALIACLLTRFAGGAANDRLTDEARFAKQTTSEVARRTAANLLTSFATRRTQVSNYGW